MYQKFDKGITRNKKRLKIFSKYSAEIKVKGIAENKSIEIKRKITKLNFMETTIMKSIIKIKKLSILLGVLLTMIM